MLKIIQRLPISAFWRGEGNLYDSSHGGLTIHCATPQRVIAELTELDFQIVTFMGDDYPRTSRAFFTDWYYYVFAKSDNSNDRQEIVRLIVHREIPEDNILAGQWNELVQQWSVPEVFYTYEWALAVSRAYCDSGTPLLMLAYNEDSLVGVALLTCTFGVYVLLAARIAQQKDCELHAFIVLAEPVSSSLADPIGGNGDASRALAQMLTNATRLVRHGLHPETLPALDSIRIAQQSKNSLVIVATNLADHLDYAGDGLGDGRALILVQGSEMAAVTAPAEFRRTATRRQAG